MGDSTMSWTFHKWVKYGEATVGVITYNPVGVFVTRAFAEELNHGREVCGANRRRKLAREVLVGALRCAFNSTPEEFWKYAKHMMKHNLPRKCTKYTNVPNMDRRSF